MSTSGTDWPTSPLAAADTAFAALSCEPNPLTFDCDIFDPTWRLPRPPVPVSALRDWLLAHRRAYGARDAVWRELIRRARLDGPAWVIAAVGMAMPALRRYAHQLRAGYAGDPDDIDAEILTGFLGALRDRVDLARPAPYASLCMAAWRAGRQLRLQQKDCQPVEDIDQMVAGPRVPRVPYGHPDLLVRRAVVLGLLDSVDEQPYIDIRLGRRAPEPIAASLGITVDALRMRLRRIDTRLAAALASGVLTGVPSPQATKQVADSVRHRRATRAAHPASVSAASCVVPLPSEAAAACRPISKASPFGEELIKGGSGCGRCRHLAGCGS